MPVLSLRIAALFSLVFWAAMVLFVTGELIFDPAEAPEPKWTGQVLDAIIFIFWASACAATASCLYALGAQRRALARMRGQLPQAEQPVVARVPPNSMAPNPEAVTQL
jgi:hypothetical protein